MNTQSKNISVDLMVKHWRELTPSERCERVALRLKKKERKACIQDTWRIRLANARERRERIEFERSDWTRLIVEHKGNVQAIVKDMGYHRSEGRRIMWDLGLWPLLTSCRAQKQLNCRFPTERLERAIRACGGNITHAARLLGVSREYTKKLLTARGLRPLVDELRRAA